MCLILFYFSLQKIPYSAVNNIFSAYENCFTAIFMSVRIFIAFLIFHKSYIPVFTHSNSINHNRIVFHLNPFTHALPVANESNHSQNKFHTVSGFTMQRFFFFLFCHSRPIYMNTYIKVFKLLEGLCYQSVIAKPM